MPLKHPPDRMTTGELTRARAELESKLAAEWITPANRRLWQDELKAVVAEQDDRKAAEQAADA
jgi:hypothetical protein